jgi:zinc transporter
MDQPSPAAAVLPPCPGLIAAWRFPPSAAAPERLDDSAALEAIAAGAEGLWLHVNLLDLRSRQLLARLPLPPAALAALTEPDEGAHLEGDAEALFGAVPDFLFDALSGPAGGGAEMALLHLALTPRLLVTARRHPLRGVHDVAQGPGCDTPAGALAAILRRTSDGMGRALQSIGQELAAVEEALLRGEAAGHRSLLAGLRRRTLQLERGFAAGAEALCALAEEAEEEEATPPMPYARPVLREARRQAAVLRAIAALKERARIAQDEMGDLAAEQINRSLFVLSVISAAMLPASLVAGIFGMNVGSLPGVDQDWGFAMAMGLIGLSILAILGLLRRWKML